MENSVWCDAKGWEGRWKPGRVLGSGKDCTAFVARSCLGDGGPKRVLKLLSPGSAPDAIWNLRKEAAALASLDHPRIPHLIETNVNPPGKAKERTPYLVMELVQGTSLKELIADRRQLDEDASLAMAEALLDPLSHCHERGRIHCDLRAANVMLRGDDPLDPVLIDFNSSIDRTQPSKKERRPAGAPPRRDPSSDLTSLARMLLHALTGRNPASLRDWNLRAPHEVSWEHGGLAEMEGERVAVLRELFDRAFATRPEDRFQAAEEMRTFLRRAREAPAIGLPDPAPAPPTGPGRMPPPARRQVQPAGLGVG